MSGAVTLASLGQKIRRIGHGFHAASHDHVGGPDVDQVVRQHHRLHP